MRAIEILRAEVKHINGNKLSTMYPDGGPLRRELYPKHLEFFRVGAEFQERCFMAANRVGKTQGGGAYESTLHLTGRYPDWWEGKRFDHPIDAWVAGKTNETTRDIIQLELLGPRGDFGTGMIPRDCVGDFRWKAGIPDFVDTLKVKHVSGGWSKVGFKSYQQGRDGFEGTAKDLIWLDEEPDIRIYEECNVRTMTTGGIIMLTFTPLEGMSETVLQFLPQEYQLDA